MHIIRLIFVFVVLIITSQALQTYFFGGGMLSGASIIVWLPGSCLLLMILQQYFIKKGLDLYLFIFSLTYPFIILLSFSNRLIEDAFFLTNLGMTSFFLYYNLYTLFLDPVNHRHPFLTVLAPTYLIISMAIYDEIVAMFTSFSGIMLFIIVSVTSITSISRSTKVKLDNELDKHY